MNTAGGRNSLQKGQALLIVILVMVIALTVGLSIAVRTTNNIRTSTEDENSERAFSAAEAGIEQAFLSNTSVPITSLNNNTSYQTTVSSVSGGAFFLNNGTALLKDESIDVWLASYPNYSAPWSGNLTVSWGAASDTCSPSEASNTQAALEIVVLSGSTNNPQATSYLLDPCLSRVASNNFESVVTGGGTISGKTFARSRTINISSGLIARIVPLYASTEIGVQASPALPSQGTVVTSVGTSDTAQRKIVSYRSHPKLPTELFPFIFFSPK